MPEFLNTNRCSLLAAAALCLGFGAFAPAQPYQARLVNEFTPGALGTAFAWFGAVENQLAFVMGDALWFTQGTPGTTRRVVSLQGFQPQADLFAGTMDGVLYFASGFADNGGATPRGIEPWRSDGTPGPGAGTFRLGDLNRDGGHSLPTGWTVAGDLMYFTATTTFGVGVYRTDGTTAGTLAVDGIVGRAMCSMGGACSYFGGSPYALRRSRGTLATTALAKALDPGVAVSASLGGGGRVFLGGYDPLFGHELWSSDGTEAGTALVKDLNPGSGASSPRLFTPGPAPGTVFFFATSPALGLWVSDGTETGTQRLWSAEPGQSVPHNPQNPPRAADGRLYFAVNQSPTGSRLWTCDGCRTCSTSSRSPSTCPPAPTSTATAR